jgi:hypothetical protein
MNQNKTQSHPFASRWLNYIYPKDALQGIEYFSVADKEKNITKCGFLELSICLIICLIH